MSIKIKIAIVLSFIAVLAAVVWVGMIQTQDSAHTAVADESPSAQAADETQPQPATASPLKTDTNEINDSEKKKLKTLIAEKLEENDFCGSVLIGVGDSVVTDISTGCSDKDKETKNTAQTTYEIGSMTKQFTAAGILHLVNEGKLDVNDKISKYFKDCKFGDDVTVDNLLSMTSGIPDYLNDNIYAVETGERAEDSTYSKKEFLEWLNKQELGFDPGSSFYY